MGRNVSGGSASTAFEIIDKQIIIASGNWTKPGTALPGDLVVADVIDGGGSGAVGTTASNSASGGAPGTFSRLEFLCSTLSATEACVVAAGGAAVVNGGAASGLPGGQSSFKGVSSRRVAGGGVAASGLAAAAPTPGLPITVDQEYRFTSVLTAADITTVPKAVFAPGQGANMSGPTIQPPGTSVNAGAGGTGVAAGTAPVGGAGVAPGGGGAAVVRTSGNGTSGAGARGEVRVYVIRGVSSVGNSILPPT